MFHFSLGMLAIIQSSSIKYSLHVHLQKRSSLTQFNFTFFYYPTRQSSVQYSWTYVIFYWISLSCLSRVNAFFYFESHYLILNVFSAILPNNSLENLFHWSMALVLRFIPQIVFTKHIFCCSIARSFFFFFIIGIPICFWIIRMILHVLDLYSFLFLVWTY